MIYITLNGSSKKNLKGITLWLNKCLHQDKELTVKK